MKFDNKLQEDIFNHFSGREDFYFHGYTGTFFFNTWKKGEEKHIVHSKKPYDGKVGISASVYIYHNRYPEYSKCGVEMKVEMYLWGYQVEEPVFQGWVESIDDLKVILKSVGL